MLRFFCSVSLLYVHLQTLPCSIYAIIRRDIKPLDNERNDHVNYGKFYKLIRCAQHTVFCVCLARHDIAYKHSFVHQTLLEINFHSNGFIMRNGYFRCSMNAWCSVHCVCVSVWLSVCMCVKNVLKSTCNANRFNEIPQKLKYIFHSNHILINFIAQFMFHQNIIIDQRVIKPQLTQCVHFAF